MAGIGFTLRKLTAQDNFIGVARAYLYATFAAVGPWILLVIILFSISYITATLIGKAETYEFFAVIIYNVLFSFLLSAPIYMVSARYTADCLYRRDASPVAGIFIASSYFLTIPVFIFGTLFYVFHATMPPLPTLLSIINVVVFSEIWLNALYLISLRNFRTVTILWVIGTVIALLLALNIAIPYRLVGMLLAMDCGLIFILFTIKAAILGDYKYRFQLPRHFGYYFRHYKGLFWSGFFLFAGMWADKVIMWTAPDAVTHLNNLRTNPTYDGAMFLAYLTIIPVMGFFILTLETNFYDAYVQYLRNIETNTPLNFIDEQKKEISFELMENSHIYIVLQGAITIALICAAPYFYNLFGYDYLQLSIFRLGTLGVFFNALVLFIVIFFSYFDSQENMLKISSFMLVSNIVLTLIFREFGFAYYGLGFCLSMILSFCLGALLLVRFLKGMTYYIFISNTLKRHDVRKPKPAPELMTQWENQ